MRLRIEEPGKWFRILIAILAFSFLVFSAGVYVTEFRMFPYTLVYEKPFAYLQANKKRKAIIARARELAEAPVPPTGRVAVPGTPQAFDGYSFVTFGGRRPSTARLIDMNGKVAHEWRRPFSQIMPDPPYNSSALIDEAMSWRFGQLFPNGDIIVTIRAAGETPDGYALAKLDKDSNLIWAVADRFHHQFSVAEDGRIYGLTYEWRNTHKHPVNGAPFLPEQVLEDFIVVLSPDGKELSRVSLLEAFTKPGFLELYNSDVFNKFRTNGWDRLHPNDVEVITPEFASHHPFMKPGMALVSLRELDALVLVDMESRAVTWALRGGWQRQHDPDLLSNGNILLYDNRGLDDKSLYSRVLEVEPKSGRVVWSYVGSAKDSFIATKWGGQERLPNGNTLIHTTQPGRLFEVTPAGEMVWDYYDTPLILGHKVSKDWLKFVPKPPAVSESAAGAVNAKGAAGADDMEEE